MSENKQYCPEWGSANEVGTSFCGECGTKLNGVEESKVKEKAKDEVKDEVKEQLKDQLKDGTTKEVQAVKETHEKVVTNNSVVPKKSGIAKLINLKILLLIACVAIVAVVGFTVVNKLGGSTDYTSDIYIYHTDDEETFIWVDGESILLDDKMVYIDIYDVQNFPMNDFIDVKDIDSYLSKDLIVVTSDSYGIYVINVKKGEVENFSKGVAFQVSEDKKEILILEKKDYDVEGDLVLVDVKSLEDEDVIDDVISFVATEDFKKIYVQLEKEILQINLKGDTKEEISDNRSSIIALVDNYLFMNIMDKKVDLDEYYDNYDDYEDYEYYEDSDYNEYYVKYEYVVYNTDKLEIIESYDYIDRRSIYIVDGDVYFLAEDNLYKTDGKKIVEVDKDIEEFYKDNGNFHINGGDFKAAKKAQQIIYINDDGDKFFFDGKKFVESDIDEDADNYGNLLDKTQVYKDGKKVLYYNEKNKWEGEELDLDDDAGAIYGHSIKSFLYIDEENDDDLYFSDGKDTEKLSFESDDILSVYRFDDNDYVVVLEDKLVYISDKGKEKEIDLDDDVNNAYVSMAENLLFILTDDDELFVYEPGDKKVKLVSKDVDDVAESNETIMYITDDELMIYANGKSKSVAEDVESVSNIND